MTTPEILHTLESMVLLVDTREQDTMRLRARLEQVGIPHERCKLDFGDYSAKFISPDGQVYSLADRVVIERKMSLDELAQCFTHGRERFTREFERAKAVGGKIYLLVENGSFEAIEAATYRSKMNPKAFLASVLAWEARYNSPVLFCKPKTSGKLIKEILYREGKQWLEGLENAENQ